MNSINTGMNKFRSFFLAVLGLFLFEPVIAQTPSKKVHIIEVREEITPGMARKLGRGLDEAVASKADLVILHINTYGGMLDAADSMRTRLLKLKIPVVAFIDNNAASAGALISIACNRIYMTEGANIGAATVVNETGEALPDKYQSYMRSIMRSTAEKRGRDPLIAEAMVDPRTYIPGVNDSGKVLTFTTSEAIKNKFCEGQLSDLAGVIKAEGFAGARQTYYKPTWVDQVISFFINPAVSGVLILIILGGIYFELQTPGIGFPLLAAAVAAILYFIPLYLEGLAANWEILLAVIGFVLLAVELFVFPGFGVAGISGITLVIVAFAFSMVGNKGFDFEPVSGRELTVAFSTVVISMFATIVVGFIMGKSILRSSRFSKMVLNTTLDSGSGYVTQPVGLSHLIGVEGLVVSVLRPGGKVEVAGKTYEAVADTGMIEKDTPVRVKSVKGYTLVVERK
jgi:membrane-bound serine protease (ClpP class)